jgi:hypothetical protein
VSATVSSALSESHAPQRTAAATTAARATDLTFRTASA